VVSATECAASASVAEDPVAIPTHPLRTAIDTFTASATSTVRRSRPAGASAAFVTSSCLPAERR
jgi:hypothetical protein